MTIFNVVNRERRFGHSIQSAHSYDQSAAKKIKQLKINRLTEFSSIDLYNDTPTHFTHSICTRSPIKEILFVGKCLIVLTKSGLSKVYRDHDLTFICLLNPDPGHCVHTVVYNKLNQTVIVAYAPCPGVLKCKILEVEALSRGLLQSHPIGREFESFSLSHPAFFEFDGAVNLALQTYSFWDMCTYKKVFEVKEQAYEEIRVSEGLTALFRHPTAEGIGISLYDIEDGTPIRECTTVLSSMEPMIFMELCREHLLIKQKDCSLKVYDLLRGTSNRVPGTKNFCPTGFIFLTDSNAILRSKSYLNPEPKELMTVSEGNLQFWRLFDCSLTLKKTLVLPGIGPPEHVSLSIEGNFVAVFASTAKQNVKGFLSAKEYFRPASAGELPSSMSPVRLATCDLGTKAMTNGNLKLLDLSDASILGELPSVMVAQDVAILQASWPSRTMAVGGNDGVVRIARWPRTCSTEVHDNRSVK